MTVDKVICNECGNRTFYVLEDGIYECEDCGVLTARLDKIERLKELQDF